jgi:uncharacterized protein (TIGR02391 family)
MINYHLIAVQIGDLLKYSTSINEINRLAGAIFRFQRQHFPNESITSERAKLIHDWILTLAKQEMIPEERNQLLVRFCHSIATDENRKDIDKILVTAGIPQLTTYKEDYNLFLSRDFHPEINKHCKELFLQGNYFHAVFEACKAYNLGVKEKSQILKDGAPLMLEVWGCERGVLKITPCSTQTDRDVQDGIKFLSAGLMQAIRNPTAHEPAICWPISKQDCLDILSLISFLFRQLDKSTYYRAD